MTASVLIGIVALICLTTMGVSVTVTSRRSVSDAFRALDRRDSQHDKSLSQVLDRLMAVKWEDFVAMRSVDEDTEGGFITPENQTEEEITQSGGQWGHLSQLRERLGLIENEAELLNEDFDESGALRREAN